MDTESSIKAYLDSLSQLPGSILLRNALAWQGLAPGDADQVLTVQPDGIPAWESPNRYAPALLQYTGATPHFRRNNYAVQNASHTLLLRYATAGVATLRYLFALFSPSTATLIAYQEADQRLYIYGQNSTPATAFAVRSTVTLTDSRPHYFFLDYNRSTGAVVFIGDGQDVDDLAWGGRIAAPATIQTGNSPGIFLGSANVAGRYWQNQIGCIGYKQTTGLDWRDFMDAHGRPKPLDVATWAEWGGAPPIWHESGELDYNRGSYGNFTRNATIKLADPTIWS